MDDTYRFQSWFLEQWSRMALPCAVAMLALLPVPVNEENRPLVLLVTLLPIYMIHQYEEHAHGRFAAFANATLGEGFDVFTSRAIWNVNIILVWVLFLVSFYLARFISLEYALIPVYLTLVNGVIHFLATARLRRYNPGLWTALVLFLPWGALLQRYVNELTGAGVMTNLVALLVALAFHAAIVVWVLRRRATLRAAGKPALSELAPGR
jgi:hypothetical protein